MHKHARHGGAHVSHSLRTRTNTDTLERPPPAHTHTTKTSKDGSTGSAAAYCSYSSFSTCSGFHSASAIAD